MGDILHQADPAAICLHRGRQDLPPCFLSPAGRHHGGRLQPQVPPELRGRGLPTKAGPPLLADWALSEGLTIVPSCSYIDVWILRRNAG